MAEEPMFHPVDLNTWPMAQIFHYYDQMAPTTYTVTVMMDVTILRNTLRKWGYRFFPSYLYLVTKSIGKRQELRMGKENGVLGYWENLTPAYPQFHKDDKTTSLLWTEYDHCFQTFYEHYTEDTEKYGNSHGILTSKGIPLPNAYIISCIPWFTFNSFSLHNHGIKDYYVPSLESGRFVESNDKIQMPLSITVNHATTEGYHLKLFFEDLQKSMNEPNSWMLDYRDKSTDIKPHAES